MTVEIYDISIDEMREVTQEDVNQLVLCRQAFGRLVVEGRGLIEHAVGISQGTIPLNPPPPVAAPKEVFESGSIQFDLHNHGYRVAIKALSIIEKILEKHPEVFNSAELAELTSFMPSFTN